MLLAADWDLPGALPERGVVWQEASHSTLILLHQAIPEEAPGELWEAVSSRGSKVWTQSI